MLLGLGFSRPQVPAQLACCQYPQAGVLPACGAVGAVACSGAFRRGNPGCSQYARAGRSLLCRDGLASILHQEPTYQGLLDFHLHPGVGRTGFAGQQSRGVPVVLDGVISGHLAAVLEAQDLTEGH